MRWIAISLAASVLLSSHMATMGFAPTVRASSFGETQMRITILPHSGPHTIQARTLVTFHLRVSGIVLDPKHIGKRPIPGHGHIQIYLDRIPPDATRHMDMRGIVAVVGTTNFSIGFTGAWLRLHAGHHRLLLALARNNDVLYESRPAAFSVIVK